MFQLRYFKSLFFAFISRFKGVLLIGFVLGIVVFLGAKVFMPILLQKGHLRLGLTGRFTTEDLPPSLLNQISMGLTTISDNGEVAPGIAKSWESQDAGKVWIFHLRDDLTWHDGTKLTSEDIRYNFEDVQTQRPDRLTVVFKLSSPFAPFPVIVSKPAFKKGLLGVGIWKVTDLSLLGNFVEKMTISDERNTELIRFYPNEERTKLAFKLGEVDEIDDLLDPKPFSDWKNVKIGKTINENRYVAVFLNTTDDLLSDKDIRQALSYGIDKQSLAGSAGKSKFDFERAYGPISPKSWAYNPQTKPYDYDLEKAKQLIDKSKINPEQKNDLKIKLSVSPALLDTAQKISDNWQEIGVKTSIQVTPLLPNDYQAFLAIYDIPSDPDQYPTWHSEGTVNISHYKNPRINKLLEDGRLETNVEDRKKIYLDFQRFLVEDAPAAFLYHPISYTVSRK